MPVPSWDDLVVLALDEIRFCGATSVQVMRRMRALLQDLKEHVLPERRAGARVLPRASRQGHPPRLRGRRRPARRPRTGQTGPGHGARAPGRAPPRWSTRLRPKREAAPDSDGRGRTSRLPVRPERRVRIRDAAVGPLSAADGRARRPRGGGDPERAAPVVPGARPRSVDALADTPGRIPAGSTSPMSTTRHTTRRMRRRSTGASCADGTASFSSPTARSPSMPTRRTTSPGWPRRLLTGETVVVDCRRRAARGSRRRRSRR
ncbi:MAG: hypothetical protein MZV64_05045 [Ignavibacteriales bacterium]|nr:hypothetical protein [Ignavibacteriales bacterium]